MRPERKKRQRRGLMEPYTVMMQERPYVVEAESIEEATEIAKSKHKHITMREEGDAS